MKSQNILCTTIFRHQYMSKMIREDLNSLSQQKIFCLMKLRTRIQKSDNTTQELVDDFSAIFTYSTKDSDFGIGKLSSINPCTCISIAS